MGCKVLRGYAKRRSGRGQNFVKTGKRSIGGPFEEKTRQAGQAATLQKWKGACQNEKNLFSDTPCGVSKSIFNITPL